MLEVENEESTGATVPRVEESWWWKAGEDESQQGLFTITGGIPDDVYRVPSEGAFGRSAGEEELLEAHDLERIGQALVLHRQPELRVLQSARLAFRWRQKGGKGGGRPTLGKIELISGWARHLSEGTVDIGVWLAADHLREREATALEVEALLFGLLLRVEYDDQGRLGIGKPEVEGFSLAEIRHYGGRGRRDLGLAYSAFREVGRATAAARQRES